MSMMGSNAPAGPLHNTVLKQSNGSSVDCNNCLTSQRQIKKLQEQLDIKSKQCSQNEKQLQEVRKQLGKAEKELQTSKTK